MEQIKSLLKEYKKRETKSSQLNLKLTDFKKQNPHFKKACDEIESYSTRNQIPIYYFGGFLRDVYLDLSPRDIDIVFDSMFTEKIYSSFSKYSPRNNSFGGLKFNIKDIEIDAWPIEKTWFFTSQKFYPSSVNQLINTTFFNSESIIMDAFEVPNEKRIVLQKGFYEACENKTLEIQNEINPFPELQIARAIHQTEKLGWIAGPNLKNFIIERINKNSLEKITNFYNNNYKQNLNSSKIEDKIQKIIK